MSDTPQLPYSMLEFTEAGVKFFNSMVDIVRKNGTLDEATMAINLMQAVESNRVAIEKRKEEIIKQKEDEEEVLEGELE